MLVAKVFLNPAVFLRKRRHRVFSQEVAGLDCPSMPFGTVLGVFTLIVLGQECPPFFPRSRGCPGRNLTDCSNRSI